MDKTRPDQPACLISVLLQADAEFGDRAAAATDLGLTTRRRRKRR